MKTYLMTQEQADVIHAYLMTRPFGEVEQAVNALRSMKQVVEETVKEENGIETVIVEGGQPPAPANVQVKKNRKK